MTSQKRGQVIQVVDPADGDGTDTYPLPELHLTGLLAAAEALGQARERLVAWVGTTGLNAEQVNDLALAVYEAMANVVDHAYDGPGGVFDLHACRRGNEVIVTVTDHGRWRAPAGGEKSWRGRGMLIIERASQEFELSPRAHGTTVSMSWPVLSGNVKPRERPPYGTFDFSPATK